MLIRALKRYQMTSLFYNHMQTIQTKRLVQTFINMVRIDSESGNEALFADFMMKTGAALGAKTRKDEYGNVYIEVAGTGEPIMLNTHMDTVSPGIGIEPRIKGEYVTSDGNTILGADSKAGIAAMIEVVTVLKESRCSHRPIVITLTCNEESGIPTAQHIVSDVKTCIVPDRGTPIGEIITEAPYAQVYQVTIQGKAVYAPTNYDQGRHAIMAAVDMIRAIPAGNIDEYTTTNIGIIQGGIMTSMVPDTCMFKGNCYSFSKESFDRFINQLNGILSKTDKTYGTHSTLTLLEYFGGYTINRQDNLVRSIERAMKDAGIRPVHKVYKAVTNANLLNDAGIKSVLISTGVEHQHTVDERISIQSLADTARILFNLVTQS